MHEANLYKLLFFRFFFTKAKVDRTKNKACVSVCVSLSPPPAGGVLLYLMPDALVALFIHLHILFLFLIFVYSSNDSLFNHIIFMMMMMQGEKCEEAEKKLKK